MKLIQLEPKHFEIVKDILKNFNIEPYVFGSRAKNAAKKLSDLDLCLMNACDKTTLRKLHDAFEESNLPFKVDIVVWPELTDSFKKQIESDLIKLNHF
ncbi:MAG: nucleotidyltransferase domain-containing protein [Pseudobdellovibrio sp.]